MIGASVMDVVMMLSKDLFKQVLIAILIAIPVSAWAMNQWLNGFAYRISIGSMIFVIAACSVILITLITISFQSLKAAVRNPIMSLRSE